ncbi:MAG: PAS domain-containing protein [bacterium]|nr:PAS domain-containing protein [bacterium]
MDRNAVVQPASPAATRLVATGSGEAVGHQLHEFVELDDFLTARQQWEEVLSKPEAVTRLQLRTRPGLGLGDPAESRVLDITIANRLDYPAVLGIIVRLRDVTDLTRAETNYQALIEYSLQGISVFCDDRVIYTNEALAQLFGTTQENLRKSGDADTMAFIHRDDRDQVRQAFEDFELDGSGEMRFLGGDGKWRWIQMRWARASWEGRPARQIAYTDVTAQKELGSQHRRENERLGAAIAERTRELEMSQQSLRDHERLASVGTLAPASLTRSTIRSGRSSPRWISRS